jgi:chromosome segregation protein
LPVERHLVAAPTAGEAVRHHVRGRTGAVDALLDRLLDRAVRVDGGWRAALDVSLAHPELVVVTESGDRFASSGWRIGTDSTGATAAALEDATGRVVDLTEQVAAQRVRRDQAAATLAAARRRESDAASQLEACDRRFAAASNNLARVQAEHQSVMSDVESLLAQQEQAAARRGGEQARVGELESLLPDLEAAESAQAARAALARSARAKLSDRASAVAALRRDLEVRAAGLQERREMLQRRLAGVEERLRVDVEERQQAEQRRVRLDQTLVALDQLRALVAGRLEQVDAHWQQLDAERQRQSEAARAVTERLDGLRRQRHDSERELEVVRERARKGELEEAELRLRLESLTEALRRDLDAEPAVAEAAPCPELPEGATAAGRARELERELKLMGPINPLALEEFTALSERSKFLDEQISDVQDTRRELNKVIRAVDAEIQSVFSAAYSDVAANFTSLFGGLFPGGTGQLVLTNPDDLLNTGIEVEAKPSGKNVKKLSLLSGGERSLTALAFLFAVFRSRPSPFYVMDEVEAALDDVNLHRFLGLVQEFRNEAQLLIVSHQKRTMEAADCLFGVTMQPGGSSKVISEKIAAS